MKNKKGNINYMNAFIRLRTISSSIFLLLIFLLLNSPLFTQQNDESSRRDTIKYGTESEIANLIQTLRTENIDYLDDELMVLIQTSRNMRILTSVFGFFGDREKKGLEDRAVKAITEREDETNETVLSAIDYLGRVKYPEAVPVLKELLNTEERRFLANGFRAIGRAGSADPDMADEAAEFLVDYYTYRNPGSDNQSIIITAIGDSGSLLGIPFLTGIATNTNERIPLRTAALAALSKTGDESSLEAILSCVSTNDPNVRSAAVAALGPFSGELVDSAILDAFRDSYYRTRIAAAQASRDRRLEAAVPFLRFRAERDEVANVKDESIRALGAIANSEAIDVLDNLFSERRNSNQVRILAGEMLMKIDAAKFFSKIVIELNEAKNGNQTNLYNGFLKAVGEAVVDGDTTEVERVASGFMLNGAIVERLYGLDMAANNNLKGLSGQIISLARDRNETLSRRARRAAETLGIEIPDV
ncbi:MAG: HEAT repeat domain-containing protein [Treponema sp.]|nr:HEAT repeat domain-containing protein [Treponema sp.]